MENEQMDLAVIASEEERDLAKVFGGPYKYASTVHDIIFTLSLLRDY